jgi:hypothetical protein
MVRLTDAEIAALISEPKDGADKLRGKLQLTGKGAHKEAQIAVTGADGHEFRVIVRQSALNVLDFSVILGFCPGETTGLFRLRRYNGKHGEHTNSIERQRFYAFHIHKATERYQDRGQREDAFAEPSDRYSAVRSATECLIQDCGFASSAPLQLSLFTEETMP